LLLVSAVCLFSAAFMIEAPPVTARSGGIGSQARGESSETRPIGKKGEPAPAEIVAKAFGLPGKPRAAVPSRVAPAAPVPPQRADWLHVLGAAEDDGGLSWLLVKDDKSGRVRKIRLDGAATDAGRLVETAQDSYTVELDGSAYSIRKR